MSNRVLAWRSIVEEERAAQCIPAEQYPTAMGLALIATESHGDASARRPRSMFCGLLQMGRAAGLDVGYPDRGIDTTAALVGDGRTAIRKHLEYLRRYHEHHDWQGWRLAVVWKGGPATARWVEQQLRAGKTRDATLAAAATRFKVDALLEYVRRFEAHEITYREALKQGGC